MPAPRINIKRECTHTRNRHRHGTRLAYRMDGCRCTPCADAWAAYMRDIRRRKAAGQWRAAYVDSEPVRQHVAALKSQGMSRKQIRRRAGVSSATMERLKTSTIMTWHVAEALLGVTLRPHPGFPIDATGTHRRIQALVACGWSMQQIANRAGFQSSTAIHSILRVQRVLPRSAALIKRIYDEMWDEPPPADTRWKRQTQARMQNYARRQGWVAPLAWDDDTIDDPAAEPNLSKYRPLRKIAGDGVIDDFAVDQLMSGARVEATKAERVEAVARLTAQGLSAAQISTRMRVTERMVNRYRAEHRAAEQATAAA